MWSPLLSESDEGVLPANAPSISISAPAGVDETSSLAAAISGALIAAAVGAAIAAGAALAPAAARAKPFAGARRRGSRRRTLHCYHPSRRRFPTTCCRSRRRALFPARTEE